MEPTNNIQSPNTSNNENVIVNSNNNNNNQKDLEAKEQQQQQPQLQNEYPHAIGKYPIHEAVYNNDLDTIINHFGELKEEELEQQQQQQQSTKEEEQEQDEEDEDDANSNITSAVSKIMNGITINDRDALGRTPLMYANTEKIVKYLLGKGARVNLRDQERQTAMHKAAHYYPQILSLLLDSGAHIKRDNSGCTPLHVCCMVGNVESVKAMVVKGPRRVKAEARDKRGKTALHYAVESNTSDDTSSVIVGLLIECGSLLDSRDREKKTPLHLAAINGKVKCLSILIEKGANVDMADIFGSSALHYIVNHSNGNKAVKQLVGKGAKVNIPDNTGQTPIFYASRSGHPKNVKALLRLGALATLKDYQSKTPLHLSLDIANPTISSMLVSAGADVTLRYKYGQKGERLQRTKIPSMTTGSSGDLGDGVSLDTSVNMENSENVEDGIHADMFGFLPDVSSTSQQVKKWVDTKEFYANLHKQRAETDKQREKKWIKITSNWDRYAHSSRKMAKVQSLSWKSVPESVRGCLWKLILMPDQIRAQSKHTFEQLLNNDSAFVKQIDLDIDRTYRNHIYFRERFSTGQQALFNVLKAYSIYDHEVGYCQGMSSIASILLMYMTEEEAFWSLVGLMEGEKYQLRGLFLPSFPLLYRHYAIHETLLHEQLPKVQAHFGVEGITTSMYATKWFLTVFSGNLPFPMMIRFWDLVLLNGYYVIHSLVIHLLRMNQDNLSKDPFEKILQFFSSLESNGVDTYSFCKGAKKHKISEKKVLKLLKKHEIQQQQALLHVGIPINS